MTLQTFPQTLSEKGSTSQLQNRYICGHGYSLATRQIQSLYRLHGWSTRSFGCLPSTWQYKAHRTSNSLSMHFFLHCPLTQTALFPISWYFFTFRSQCTRTVVKNPPANAGDRVQSLGQERPLKKEMATHSEYSCLGNPTDRRAWWATVHGVTKSRVPLSIHAGREM